MSHKTDLYHPNRDNYIIAVKCTEFICHTKHCRCAEHKRRFINQRECSGDSFVRGCGFLDFERTEFSVALDNNINFTGIFIAVIIDIRREPRILIALRDFGNNKVFEKCSAHRTAFGNFRGRPFCQITNQSRIVEIEFRRFDRPFQRIIGIGMQEKYDAERFKDAKPCFGSDLINIRIVCHCFIVYKLRSTGGSGGDEFGEFQCVNRTGQFSDITLDIGGYIGRIENIAVGISTGNQSWHASCPDTLKKFRRSKRSDCLCILHQLLKICHEWPIGNSRNLSLRKRGHVE